ncbi:hypothetical protein M3T53_01180 [Actinomyces sp. B33]|uniref:YkvI family membrane protein n=1 Tax=Actinomyces sp. B33 TaxID=2942131 RepID=UPI002340460B|nr:hypothetical protein [Actinomyces sp. B33]MDC4232327.1 hypothetical protein [Actinomyces sp. B33]
MLKKMLVISLAFIGLVVGAGFASGQEVLQYFIAHGVTGLWGALLAAVLFAAAGFAILQLGSYFLAKEHSIVYDRVTHPIVSRLLDAFTSFTLFSIGFVMLAGAGSNLNQQFGVPVWAGSALMALVVFAVGFLDVDKVTAVIGMLTPLVIVFVLGAAAYALTHADAPIADLDAAASHIRPAIGNWLLSSLNYVGLTLATGVSMALVMGGDLADIKVAGRGGLVGGAAFGLLLLIAAASLFAQVGAVQGKPMPMLALVNAIHPVAGSVMAVVIFGMIFNTAIGMYYALAKRVTAQRPGLFVPAMAGLLVVGYALSFVGFEALIGHLFPLIGYVGMALVAVLIVAWAREREAIAVEHRRRMRIRDLVRRKWELGRRFTRRDSDRLAGYLEDSNIDDTRLHRTMSRAAVEEIKADDEAEVEPRWEAVEERWDAERADVEAAALRAEAEASREGPADGGTGPEPEGPDDEGPGRGEGLTAR